jgi:hypothetical protein
MAATQTDRASLLEAVILNNRGVGHLMAGETKLAIQCLTRAMSISGQANGNIDMNTPVVEIHTSALTPVSIPISTSFYICNQAYLLDPFTLGLTRNEMVPCLWMFAVVLFNVGMAVHHSAMDCNGHNADRAVHTYSLCLQVLQSLSLDCPVGAALCAATTNNLAQVHLHFFSNAALASDILTSWLPHLDLLMEHGQGILGDHWQPIVISITMADSLNEACAAMA